MKSTLNHLQVNIDLVHIGFYKDLMRFLGWKKIADETSMAGFSDGKSSIWFLQKQKDGAYEYDGTGINHIGIGVDIKEDVDNVATYLLQHEVTLLFDTPKARPEFAGDGELYYQVMFESPDRILFEIMYSGKK